MAQNIQTRLERISIAYDSVHTVISHTIKVNTGNAKT